MLRKFDQDISEGILFVDQYELMMAQMYFKLNMHEKPVQFDHYFRNYPDYGSHKAGYCINAGLEWLVDWMQNVSFSSKEAGYLRDHRDQSGKRVFQDEFIKWLLSSGSFSSITLHAAAEGRVIHPNEPISVVRGPLAMAQMLETALLNQLNFQILIATKASRIKQISGGRPVLEFGARRAQDRGAVAGVRGALIGGADYSSNAGISYLLGYAPKGTHAHSMIQLFLSLGMNELDAFEAFADLYPDECVLLVDTINTLESGIPNAIKVFEKLRRKGHKPGGIRLDSGDLAYLSIQAAKLLNEAGFSDVPIVLSNELDEINIWQIVTQIREDSPKRGMDAGDIIGRLIYGVGTRLITSSGDPALGGVYKLVAVKDGNRWNPVIKVSETIEKIPNPGLKKLWRIYDSSGKATADYIALPEEDPLMEDTLTLRHPSSETKIRVLDRKGYEFETLLLEILAEGKVTYNWPSIEEIRKVREKDLNCLDTGVKRLINPHVYHVSISPKLWDIKHELLEKLKK